MCCETCPFAGTDASEHAQNLACLPTPFEIMEIKRTTGKSWACHGNNERVCAGFIRECRERGIEYRGDELTNFERWYHEGHP